jgi:glucokinase
MKNNIVGVDIGGTNISAGLIINGKVEKVSEVPTEAFETEDKIVNNLIKAINQVISSETEAIGIGVPGMVDSEKGIIYDLTNIPAWKEVHIKKLVEKQFERSTCVGNDANCFVLGVKHFGIGQNYKNIIGATLGTGLGAGIIINDELYTGLQNGAGEYGLIPYLESSLEDYCSGKFFSRIKNLSGEEVYKNAQNGVQEAIDIWTEYGHHLGQFVNILLSTMAPDLIVFGGSVAKGFPFFIDSIRTELDKYILQKVAQNVQIHHSVNGDSAILGAGALCI